MEGLGVTDVIAYFDARGWQTLVENSILQLPVPGAELATLLMPNYMFGGPEVCRARQRRMRNGARWHGQRCP